MISTRTAPVVARRAGFLRDIVSLGSRALRSIPRDPESVIPALIVPVFFFAVNVGALQDLAESMPGLDYKAFQLPVAILFAVTGVTRANILVIDIQDGYFDRLALTPVNRLAMLLGFMVADVALVLALSLPVIALGFAVGVRFESGPLGILAFLAIGALWAIVYNAFPYAVALKTGNPAAVNSSFLLFLPVVFLTTIFVPCRGAHRMDATGRGTESRDLPAGRHALAREQGLGRRRLARGPSRDSSRGHGKHAAGAVGAVRAGAPGVGATGRLWG